MTDNREILAIQRLIASTFDVPLMEMTSRRRARHVVRPRQIAMYLARELTPCSFPEIARAFGKKDHTTVIWAINRVQSLMERDASLQSHVKWLRNQLVHPRNPCSSHAFYPPRSENEGVIDSSAVDNLVEQ